MRLGLAARSFRRRLPAPPVWTDPDLATITTPVQLLLGAKSALHDSTAVAGRIATAAPSWRIEVVPGTGHALPLEAPELVVASRARLPPHARRGRSPRRVDVLVNAAIPSGGIVLDGGDRAPIRPARAMAAPTGLRRPAVRHRRNGARPGRGRLMPRRVDHVERRAHITAALLRIAATRGLQAVTMREVAAEAGLSLRLVQYSHERQADPAAGGARRTRGTPRPARPRACRRPRGRVGAAGGRGGGADEHPAHRRAEPTRPDGLERVFRGRRSPSRPCSPAPPTIPTRWRTG